MIDGFLKDPDNLHYRILCIQCRKPIWETKILKRAGNQVISSETQIMGEHGVKFSNRISQCPICETDPFYARGKRGAQLYLIHDLKSKLTRLI